MPRRDRDRVNDQPLRLGAIRNSAEVARVLRRLLRIRATLRLDRERFRDLVDGMMRLHEVYQEIETAKAHQDLLAALPQLQEREKEVRARVLRLVRGGQPESGEAA